MRPDSSIQPVLSVVMPIFNEEDCLPVTLPEVIGELDKILIPMEIIAVDDGSSDSSLKILRQIRSRDERLKIISFKRNYGKADALAAGIESAVGEFIFTIDADGQDDPREVEPMLRQLQMGKDFVAGWRRTRRDNSVRRIPSRIANWLIGKSTGVKIHDYGCGLKGFRSQVLQDVTLIGEMHRMLPILVSQRGGVISEHVVNHRPRLAGVAKYGLARTPRVLADLFVARFLLQNLSKPMHFFGQFSLWFLLSSIVSGFLAVSLKVWGDRDFVESPLLMISLFSAMFSITTLLSGLAAELIVRIYFRIDGPPYRVGERVGF